MSASTTPRTLNGLLREITGHPTPGLALARAMGTDKTQVSRWLNGRVRAPHALMAAAYGMWGQPAVDAIRDWLGDDMIREPGR